jgi:hypothetical protein
MFATRPAAHNHDIKRFLSHESLVTSNKKGKCNSLHKQSADRKCEKYTQTCSESQTDFLTRSRGKNIPHATKTD